MNSLPKVKSPPGGHQLEHDEYNAKPTHTP